ncbi:MAG: glycoside hydrolase family 55 protein [Fischerella sp. CENA71]|nr:glycoside hydrolase family 55 protein [Fischerella sp. CENA71]
MKRRTFLTSVILCSVTSSLPILFALLSSKKAQAIPNKHIKIAQNQSLPTYAVNVKQFGSLVNGITNNPKIIANNTAVIQAAIDAVGNNGGGTIYIPQGIYQVAPPNLTADIPASIVINYDNITLIGDGIGKTILQSRGDWSVINGQVVRGMGILIKGSDDTTQPRKNITIKNLELSGGTNGFTGNRVFPADPTTGDGWDISHKGIVLDFNKSLDNITIDSVYVHDFRGELIYAGGIWIGKVTISDSKLHSSNASMLSLDAELTVNHCEFSKTANAWVENAPLSPNKYFYFDKCIFKDSIASGLVIAQGKFPENHNTKITNSAFFNSPAGVCPFGGSSNLFIENNKFVDCGNALFTSGENRNIKFYSNEIIAQEKSVISINIWGILKNIHIKKNRQKSIYKNNTYTPCVVYFGDLQNIVIEDNIFENCLTPEQSAHLSNERPLFLNNQYIDVLRRESQGTANIWQSSYIVEPKFEEIVVFNKTSTSFVEVAMSTDYYVDGQEVLIVGGANNEQVKFSQNSSTIRCQSDRYLSGKGEKLKLRFNKSNRKWYEVSYLTATA